MTTTDNPNIADLGWVVPIELHVDGTAKFEVTPHRIDGSAAGMEADLIGTVFTAPQGGQWRITNAFRPSARVNVHGHYVYIITAEVVR